MADHDLASMQALLAKQKAEHLRDGAPSAEKRIERLDRCVGLPVVEFRHRKSVYTQLKNDIGPLKQMRPPLEPLSGPLFPAKAGTQAFYRRALDWQKKPGPSALAASRLRRAVAGESGFGPVCSDSSLGGT